MSIPCAQIFQEDRTDVIIEIKEPLDHQVACGHGAGAAVEHIALDGRKVAFGERLVGEGHGRERDKAFGESQQISHGEGSRGGESWKLLLQALGDDGGARPRVRADANVPQGRSVDVDESRQRGLNLEHGMKERVLFRVLARLAKVVVVADDAFEAGPADRRCAAHIASDTIMDDACCDTIVMRDTTLSMAATKTAMMMILSRLMH
jgi:hypothetical protein